MITTNHENKKYKNNGIVNGSRGYIDSIQTMIGNPDVAEVIWVRFNDDKTGQLLIWVMLSNYFTLRYHW